MSSLNIETNKIVMDRYRELQSSVEKCLVMYIWIDGSGENMRCKTRTLDSVPTDPAEVSSIFEREHVLQDELSYSCPRIRQR